MKSILFFLIFSTAIFSAQDDISGFWKTAKGKCIFSIYKKDTVFEGKVVWLDSAYTDINNPDEAKHDDPLIGIVAMTKLKYNAKKNKWEKGKVYDFESGNTYSCEAKVAEDSKTLVLRGYAGISLLGRSTTWTKVEPGSFKENSTGIE